MFTLVSEIYYNVDLVLGMKNVFELEGVIDTQNSSFKFLNRSTPICLKETVNIKTERKEIHKDRSNICRWNFRTCYSKNIGQ